MKRIFLLMALATIMLFIITGCGVQKYNDIIIDDKEVSLNDIIEEYKGNSAAAAEKYITKNITYTGEIETIESSNTANLGGCSKSIGLNGEKYYRLKFVNNNINIILYVNDSEINIDDYKVGDVVTVNTSISNLYDYKETTQPSIYFIALASYSGGYCSWGDEPTVLMINK